MSPFKAAMRALRRLGVDELNVGRSELERLLVLLVVCTLSALVVVDYARTPGDVLKPGDVAPRTVKAPFTFRYAEQEGYEAARAEAADAALPVYVYRADLADELRDRLELAFGAGTEALGNALARRAAEGSAPPEAQPAAPAHVLELLEEPDRRTIRESFVAPLRVRIPDDDVHALLDVGFADEHLVLAQALLEQAMANLILADRDALPPDRRPFRVIELRSGDRTPSVISDYDKVLTPPEARQQVSIGVLESKRDASRAGDASAALARALVRPNLTFDPLQTEEARRQAAAAVELEVETVKRGAILFRAGDTLTPSAIQVYAALQEHHGDKDLAMEVFAITLFLLLLLGSLYHFASQYLGGLSNRVRDTAAVGGLLVFTALLARVTVASADQWATLVGFEAEAQSVWFLVPVAGGAMLVRLLVGVSWTVVFSVGAAALCGLVMELQALPVIFFLISAVAAAGAVEHTRERIAVLRAGAFVGLVNAAAVLVIHLVQLFVVEGELSLATTMRPFWSMTFAFLGGIASSFLVLGLVPLFEAAGFVTDYRLMELANLNHPLLRQIMLRSPGSYHHSVIVASLSEAACEAIGANALSAKVACYFHDIGKSLKPASFVENQRDGHNKHEALDPHTSAQIIISHVTEGARLAREHNLPKPIVDNIYMHHGTGILQFFYAKARAQAEDPDQVDAAAFRYPGPKPDTREAGVIMLADKIEAATRTIKVPDEDNIRAMISRIVSSVIADGQFTECPLTFQEIHTVTDTFVAALMGIYHQRIEYPQTRDLSRSGAKTEAPAAAPKKGRTPPRHAVITLDLVPSGQAPGSRTEGEEVKAKEPTEIDYEAVKHLPGGDS